MLCLCSIYRLCLTPSVVLQLTGHHPFGNVDRFPHVSSQRLGFPCRRDTLQDEYLLSVAQQHTDWVGWLLFLHAPPCQLLKPHADSLLSLSKCRCLCQLICPTLPMLTIIL